MDYLFIKPIFDFIDDFNKIIGKEGDHHIYFETNSRTENIKWHYERFYCYPTSDLKFEYEDLKTMIEIERDMIFLAFDRMEIICNFLRGKKDLSRLLENI